jgi:hypothetical protein
LKTPTTAGNGGDIHRISTISNGQSTITHQTPFHPNSQKTSQNQNPVKFLFQEKADQPQLFS